MILASVQSVGGKSVPCKQTEKYGLGKPQSVQLAKVVRLNQLPPVTKTAKTKITKSSFFFINF